MLGQHRLGAAERGDRMRDPGDAGAAPAGKRKPLDRTNEQRRAFVGEGGRRLKKEAPSLDHAAAHDVGLLALRSRQLGSAGPRQRDDEIEPVQQRPRELVAVAVEALRRAGTAGARVSAAAARTQVHGPDELELGREQAASGDSRDGDDAVLERLSQGLQDEPRELRQLIEKENAVVGERGLAGPHRMPPPTIAAADAV